MKAIVLSLLSLSFHTAASDWDVHNHHSHALSSEVDAMMHLDKNHRNAFGLYLTITDDSCRDTVLIKELRTAYVNQTPKTFIRHCVSMTKAAWYPKTEDGTAKLLNAFQNSPHVTLRLNVDQSITFGTDGFHQAFINSLENDI
ncbi:hypothetical protein [Vibrio barjaei]|uniref:hypothetical protein n=1 Tax=Vibrio barjaei TaxID=1676683 RepID=UPI002284CE14|nr:hypothetical protein [Vibrio barjaei]MCY9870492.1 hypothetical protein [Vibrio barjaei]